MTAADGVVALAYSGGRDSTALLHATVAAARAQGLRVVALHVHHGLNSQADAWLAHCERQCRMWARRGDPLIFMARKLDLRIARGQSIEAVARQGRYDALAEMAREAGASIVLLGHHRRDQAETFVLQALRGAGVAGLAGMPACIEREGITWARPWLAQPREAIEAYVRRHRLRYVDDDSNSDARFARNRLRLAVWPVLAEAFADAETTLSAAAAWAAEAQAVLLDVAQADLMAVQTPQGVAMPALCALGQARARNALRAWFLREAGVPMPSALLRRVMNEWTPTGGASWAAPAGALRCYRGQMRFEQGAGGSDGVAPVPSASACVLSITRAGRYAVPGWAGVLHIERVREAGVALSMLQTLQVRVRSGGEQFQLAPDRPARSLKKQFQAQGVPAWARQGPLLFVQDRLIFVPGLGVDARVWAPAGQAQVRITWAPNEAAQETE